MRWINSKRQRTIMQSKDSSTRNQMDNSEESSNRFLKTAMQLTAVYTTGLLRTQVQELAKWKYGENGVQRWKNAEDQTEDAVRNKEIS
jgi:hypothetical protein